VKAVQNVYVVSHQFLIPTTCFLLILSRGCRADLESLPRNIMLSPSLPAFMHHPKSALFVWSHGMVWFNVPLDT